MHAPAEWLSAPRTVAGAMSGTSLDGVDAVVARFEWKGERTRIELRSHFSVEFLLPFRQRLLRLIEAPVHIAELADAACELMQYYIRALRGAIDAAQLAPEAIGIHGQTLWHAPSSEEHGALRHRTTFQLATPALVAAAFGVPVVSDVRSADIALGGQGAPLVPLLDWELLCSNREYRIALNIGGIANVTLLPPACSPEHVRAFDTGPGNVLIDMAMQRYWGKRYDSNGSTAAAGTIIPALLEQLKTIPFLTAPPPKSTGRELFSRAFLERYITPYENAAVPAEDIIATLTALTAWSIAENIRRYGNERATVVVSGGGAKNATLLRMLSCELPHAKVMLSAELIGIPESAKEALLMAYIAFRTLGGLPSSLPSVTGAARAAVLGSITPPP